MILRGILDQSLGQVCIRGYASLSDLEEVSRADFLFQRNLIEEQKETILQFLQSSDLFFPEVILSYVVKYDFSKSKSIESISPLIEIQTKKSFKSNVDEISFKRKEVDHGFSLEAHSDKTSIVSIEIDNIWLQEQVKNDQQPFLRIDGNHRLSAAKEFREKEKGITNLVAPFCIILLPEDSLSSIKTPEKSSSEKRDALKFEKTVFHNINSKSVPLTEEEILRVVVDDEKNFPDSELLSRDDFGEGYLFTRKNYQNISHENLPAIAHLLYEPESKIEYRRTILYEFYNILSSTSAIGDNFAENKLIHRTFIKTEQWYDDQPLLQQSNSRGLFVAFLYFIFKANKFNLEWFTKWILENHIYELKTVSSFDLIAIFNKLIESKSKTIFVSMQFGDTVCETNYNLIKDVVTEINKELGSKIALHPLRIDKYKDGSAYKIPDAILTKIEECGLLIADLTKGNKNVYHEVGYLMGLNKYRKPLKQNLIMLCNTTHTTLLKDVGFNIRTHKILPFNDTQEVRAELKEEIINHYHKS